MTRLWAQSETVIVTITHYGRPKLFIWKDKTHTIARILEEWEIDTNWWESSGRIWCAYYSVLTDDGLLCVLYQELPDGEWYFSTLYD